MTTGLSRRAVLVNAFALPMLAGLAGPLAYAQGSGLRFGPAQRFGFEWLKAEAKRLATLTFNNPAPRAADVLDRLDYDDHNTIRFKPERSLWAQGGPYPIQFFHLGKWFKSPVKIHLIEGGEARVASDRVRRNPAFGTMRAQIANMVTGVTAGFSKTLEIVGTGYRAAMDGKKLVLQVGYSHPVAFQPPEGITIKVENPTKLTVSGADKALVGQVAADIRAVRPPEPYKGKGIKYEGEYIRRKAGKAAGAAT